MTASHFTPRLALPYPDESDPADVPLDLQNLAVKLDGVVARTPGQALTAAPVLDVGLVGQIRAGRQLTAGDFTALGLTAPLGLWNLSDLTDASGNGRALSNKGAVPFGVGINGLASSAAVFSGSTAQALYIADTGAADPFRLKTGSWGCWFRTAKRGVGGNLLGKWRDTSVANQRSWVMNVSPGSVVSTLTSPDGTGATWTSVSGVSDVADDRWHFAVAVLDGTVLRLYIDGLLESSATVSGLPFACPGPFNIGAGEADATTVAASPSYGRIDEAFVTGDVLSPDQVRGLYCAKLAHGFGVTPAALSLAVRRRRRGAALAPADFPTAPLRLYNFTGGALTDQGSNGQALTNLNAAALVAGADGSQAGAYNFVLASAQSLASTDAGLPSGTTARSYGCWFKTVPQIGSIVAMVWGTLNTGDTKIFLDGASLLKSANAADVIAGPFCGDGQWHFAVVVEDNAAGDGVKRKLYLDGRVVGGSTVLTALTLAGANAFRVGANPDGGAPFGGQLDGAFVCGYALTADQIGALYAKGGQVLGSSVKEPGTHVEAVDATSAYVLFDTLESQHLIDLAVTG